MFSLFTYRLQSGTKDVFVTRYEASLDRGQGVVASKSAEN